MAPKRFCTPFKVGSQGSYSDRLIIDSLSQCSEKSNYETSLQSDVTNTQTTASEEVSQTDNIIQPIKKDKPIKTKNTSLQKTPKKLSVCLMRGNFQTSMMKFVKRDDVKELMAKEVKKKSILTMNNLKDINMAKLSPLVIKKLNKNYEMNDSMPLLNNKAIRDLLKLIYKAKKSMDEIRQRLEKMESDE